MQTVSPTPRKDSNNNVYTPYNNPPENFNDVHDVGTRGTGSVNHCRYLAVAAATQPLRVTALSVAGATSHTLQS